MLVLLRREDTGWVQATARADVGEAPRFVDEGAVGSPLRLVLPTAIRPRVAEVASTGRLLSAADRLHSAADLLARNVALGKRIAPIERRVATPSRVRPPAAYVLDSILLHGGLIDQVELVGRDAALLQVDWIPTRAYAELDGWEDLGTFRLPLTNHAPYYPAWSTAPGPDVARERLLHAPPRTLPPWDVAAWPPPPNAAGVLLDQAARYLGPAFTPLDQALRRLLQHEITELCPQFQVEIHTHPEIVGQEGVSGAEVVERLFDAVYGAAADPQMARVLGLMHTDLVAPGSKVWDYVVSARFAGLWMQRLLAPWMGDARLATLRKQLQDSFGGTADDPSDERVKAALGLLGKDVACLSMATALQAEPAPAPAAPRRLAAEIRPEPSLTPLQAEASLTWEVPPRNFFEEPTRAQVFYALRRKGVDGDRVLNRPDEDSGLRAPIVPTREAAVAGKVRWVDRQLTHYGAYTWRLSGMDPFGRWGPAASAKGTVVDRIAPLSPAVVSAELSGDPAAAPTWTEVAIVFDWTASQAADAPDLARFRVHLRQGDIAPIDAELPSTWGRFEHLSGTHAAPIDLPWPLVAGPLGAPAGLTATLAVAALGAAAGGGHRLTVRVGPIQRPFDAAGYARVSATATAVDTAGNESGPGRRVLATRADPGVPPPPALLPGPQWGSLPDARARSFYRVLFSVPAGTRAQVLAAAEVALLTTAGTPPAAWEVMDLGSRVAHLKALARAHQACFRPVHERPLDEHAADYRVELNGNDRGMTVISVSRIGKTGSRSAWPDRDDCFAVVAVPRIHPPPRPLVDEARASDRSASLRIQPDPTRETVTFKIYRTRHPDRLDDVRRMRLMASLPVPSWAPGEAADPVLFLDASPAAWRTYGYRVVAVGAAGALSEPTDPIFLRPWSTAPPEAPAILTITRNPSGDRRRVLVHVARPDYRFELLRRPAEGIVWGAARALDPAALSPVEVDGGYRITIDDPVATDQVGLRFAYKLRVRDPGGATADSPIRMEAP